MRITQSMMMGTFLKNLNNNLAKMSDLQMQNATNRRLLRLSDDPVALLSALQVRERISSVTQYSKNIDQAGLWLNQAESSLKEVNTIIVNAYEAIVQGATDTMSQEDRNILAAEIVQMRDQLLNVSNSRMNSQYIFGGFNTTTPPFTVDAGGNILYNGVDMVTGDPADLAALQADQMQFEVASGGLYMNVSYTGVEVLGTGTDNLYHILDSLYNDLTSGAPVADISAYSDVLLEKQSEVLGKVADIGARTNRLTLLQTRYEDDLVSYRAAQSKIEDADLAEVVMNYKMAEAVYTASLNAGAGIIQHTLLDYL